MKQIEVAAAIFRRNGRIFLCRRGEGGNCAHLWEFPGGKLEAGETPEDCLIRECREELQVEIKIDGLYEQFDYDYPDRSIRFYFFDARILQGEPQLKVHTQAAWLWPKELALYEACPADVELIKRLSGELPFSHYLWDFDGTLFDTYPKIASALQAAFADFGHAVSYEEVLTLSKRSVMHALDTLMKRLQTTATLQQLKDRYRHYEGGYSQENAAPLYPGMLELLEEIVRRGGKHYLYTHRGASALRYMEGCGISHMFTDCITSADGYAPKPAPDAVLALIDRQKMITGRVVMVGDRGIDVEAAQNAGAFGCFFDPDHFYDDYEIELRANTVEELRKLLLGE